MCVCRVLLSVQIHSQHLKDLSRRQYNLGCILQGTSPKTATFTGNLLSPALSFLMHFSTKFPASRRTPSLSADMSYKLLSIIFMVMTEQRELNLAPLCSRGPSVGSHTEQKMETLMCAVHLYVRGVHVCICVYSILWMQLNVCVRCILLIDVLTARHLQTCLRKKRQPVLICEELRSRRCQKTEQWVVCEFLPLCLYFQPLFNTWACSCSTLMPNANIDIVESWFANERMINE